MLLLLPTGWRELPEGSGTSSSYGCQMTPAPAGSTSPSPWFTDPLQHGKAVVLGP